jgi:hypothetical protein
MVNEPQPHNIFPTDTIEALEQLGGVLRTINTRMKQEGYDIIDGRIIHIATGKPYEPPKGNTF